MGNGRTEKCPRCQHILVHVYAEHENLGYRCSNRTCTYADRFVTPALTASPVVMNQQLDSN